jgi:hypothetical protein
MVTSSPAPPHAGVPAQVKNRFYAGLFQSIYQYIRTALNSRRAFFFAYGKEEQLKLVAGLLDISLK